MTGPMTDEPRAASKAVGETVEELVVEAVDELEPATVPESWEGGAAADYWHDAQPDVALFASEQIAMVGICVIEPEQPVEIKAASVEISNGPRTRCGRFYITRRQHERLLAEDGIYLFVLYDSTDDVELVELLATPAVIVEGELRPTWYEVSGRSDYYQISADRLPLEAVGGDA